MKCQEVANVVCAFLSTVGKKRVGEGRTVGRYGVSEGKVLPVAVCDDSY